MKKMLLAVTVLTAGLLFSCNSGSDPKAVLIDFTDALSKKDISKARKLATEDSKQMLDMMDAAMKMENGTKDDGIKVDSEFDKTNMEFSEAKIEGDKATVPVKDKKSGKTTNYILKKEDGKWKVAFSKSSLMEMEDIDRTENEIPGNSPVKDSDTLKENK
ncbi:MAG: DUF4878 domain-containing protein [Chitinophagaceae bacterium]|nr:DUF4878 domain-containing protein [Chitinophagaceae bacterium]